MGTLVARGKGLPLYIDDMGRDIEIEGAKLEELTYELIISHNELYILRAIEELSLCVENTDFEKFDKKYSEDKDFFKIVSHNLTIDEIDKRITRKLEKIVSLRRMITYLKNNKRAEMI